MDESVNRSQGLVRKEKVDWKQLDNFGKLNRTGIVLTGRVAIPLSITAGVLYAGREWAKLGCFMDDFDFQGNFHLYNDGEAPITDMTVTTVSLIGDAAFLILGMAVANLTAAVMERAVQAVNANDTFATFMVDHLGMNFLKDLEKAKKLQVSTKSPGGREAPARVEEEPVRQGSIIVSDEEKMLKWSRLGWTDKAKRAGMVAFSKAVVPVSVVAGALFVGRKFEDITCDMPGHPVGYFLDAGYVALGLAGQRLVSNVIRRTETAMKTNEAFASYLLNTLFLNLWDDLVQETEEEAPSSKERVSPVVEEDQ